MPETAPSPKWNVSTNRHPTTGGEPWGSLDARRHPAGGAGTWPSGMQITWEGEHGRQTAARIAACEFACRPLTDPEREIPELIDSVRWLLGYIADGASIEDGEMPSHRCDFVHNPESGACEVHERLAAVVALLGRICSPSTPPAF